MKLSYLLEHSYSSTQIDLPTNISSRIYKWGIENIPQNSIYAKDDMGRQSKNDIHVTVLYGLTDEKADKIRDYLDNYGQVRFCLKMFKYSEIQVIMM